MRLQEKRIQTKSLASRCILAAPGNRNRETGKFGTQGEGIVQGSQ